MRNRLIAAIVFAASSTALVAMPVVAEAKQRVLVCKNVAKKATNGTIIGAVGGGLVGHTVAGHGDKTAGTLIGAGAGALAGHEIAKSNAKKKRCHYVYR